MSLDNAIRDTIRDTLRAELQRLLAAHEARRRVATDKLLWTEREAAQALGVSPLTLRNWRAEGRIRCHRQGRLVLYRREHLDEIVELLGQD